MSALVSVVIPVYNSWSYISDCVDSVLAQTYQHFEIILIDDGSTDRSLDILTSYQKNDKVTLLQIENSGQSVARNLGVEHARGKYLIFIDSDDCWYKNALEVTVSLAEKMQLDMILFDGESFIDDKITDELTKARLKEYLTRVYKSDTYVRNAPKGVFTGLQYLNYQLDNYKFIASPVLYLYKLECFQNIRFVPGIIHEDNAFTMELLIKNSRIMAMQECLYRRRIRQNSVMTTPKTIKNINGLVGVLNRMAEVFSVTKDANIKKSIIRLMDMMLSTCSHFIKQIDVEVD